MKVLIADDEPIFRRLLHRNLDKAGYEVVEAEDGADALRLLEGDDAPPVALLDWLMPTMNGLDVCRAIRRRKDAGAPYVILVTSKDAPDDVVLGLDAGADDYVTKPFNPRELRARVQVGARIVGLQTALRERVGALEEALDQVQRLQGLLPICAWCHKIRDDHNYWQSVERYLSEHAAVRFSHTICPECRTSEFPPAAGQAQAAGSARQPGIAGDGNAREGGPEPSQ